MTDRKHPDEVVKMICSIAKDHGFAVTDIIMIGMKPMGNTLPEHRYGFANLPSDKKSNNHKPPSDGG